MARKVRRATVLSATQITPHLKRITVGSAEFADFPVDQKGAYVKVLLPHPGQSAVEIDLNAAQPATMRSYTIRSIDPVSRAITLDFVINHHQGIATHWAKHAKPGDQLAIAGPGPRKLTDFRQSHYLLLGDLTSVNAINAYLSYLPAAAHVDVLIHVSDQDDIIALEKAESHTKQRINWLVTSTPDTDVVDRVTELLAQYSKAPLVFMALEAGLVRSLKHVMTNEFAIPRQQIISSGYWKKGVDADGFKRLKQQAAAQNIDVE
ncbi:siderophore-interacting protein [Pseudoalteromonas mariniglutinosa]|uniref:siderophore-interacting protein n=1 Tax=Pseudoalteromonas mariniglutinosa TaxID=206042 RepID=UPI003850BB82